MGKGPVTQGAIHCLLTHKEYTVKMVNSNIKEMDLDSCADQTTKDLEASGLFDLSRVCLSPTMFSRATCPFLFTDGCLDFRHWCT